MPHAVSRSWLPFVFVMGLASGAVPSSADEEEEDLGRPGLQRFIATDEGWWGTGDSDDRLAFWLDAKESFVPRQPPGDMQSIWSGRLQVFRPGKYVFRAEVFGKFTLTVAGVVALEGAGEGPEPESIIGEPVELKYGQTPIEAKFEKIDAEAPARLRVFWRREGDFEAPIPVAVFNHLPGDKDPGFVKSQALKLARERVVELRCTACHKRPEDDVKHMAFDSLTIDRAPDLAGIGDRVREAWLYHWLDEPHAWRSKTTMPDLFTDLPADRVDLFAATKYLASLKVAGKDATAVSDSSVPAVVDETAARKSMAAVGCIACHLLPGEDPKKFPDLRTLQNLGDKSTVTWIRRRIADPRAFRADSRMPDFKLQVEQPRVLNEIAEYLAAQRTENALPEPMPPGDDAFAERWKELFTEADQRGKFESLPKSERWPALGRRVVEVRGCINCHALEGLQPRLVASAWPTRFNQTSASGEVLSGCLSAKTRPGEADFRLGARADFDSIRLGFELLTQLPNEALNAAPLYTAEDQLRRTGCLNCHGRGREEGAFANRILSFASLGTDQTIHDLAPPNLAGIGEKLTTTTLKNVIDGKERARPWMALRMPEFKPEHVAGLAEALVARDGLDPRAKPIVEFAAASTEDEIEIGRQMVGRTGLNCVSCHDIRGIPSIGVRGPDLANVARRVRPEWFRSWLLDPQRLAPGTRMPTVFFAGKSAAPQFLDGDPERQIAAFWNYLSQGKAMQMPSLAPPPNAVVPGGENPRFTPTDRPLVVRGFMPGTAGLRGIAIGTPARIHFAFDSERCTLAAVWTGDFAEVGGWYDNGRGPPEDNAVKPLGQIIWREPERSGFYRAEDRSASPEPLPVQFGSVWATAADLGYGYSVRLDDAQIRVVDRLRPEAGGFVRTLILTSSTPTPELRLHTFDAAGKSQDAIVPALEPNVPATVTLRFPPPEKARN